jgi:hypothetical protein
MSFVEQVRLFESTDVLIAPHGAALQNLVFMRPHSSVIEIMTSPWYEPGYQPTALLFDLHYFALPQTDLDRVSDCAFYNECTGAGEADPLGQYALLIERRSLHCYGMRTCACVVDVHALEVVLWQASQVHVCVNSRICSAYPIPTQGAAMRGTCMELLDACL